MKQRRPGFTMMELLVAMAIIAILAAVLFPILARARRKAHETVCVTNLRQIGTAMQIYRQDFDEKLPFRLSHIANGYLSNVDLLHCPLDPGEGKHTPSDRLEGTLELPSGVSYTWVPNWGKAHVLGWWGPWPARGSGKWFDETPISECHWQWARQYNATWETDRNRKASANALLLLKGGGIKYWPGARSVEEYNPQE
ncbi:MAG: prepilin-type N-terminal cleavage/methylation domain-containing protein [Armatimonadetes bacterium]|nr:prepilin-type N-terminal cleavage/methylation domain-containing protein [Armatimonadota bacterium]NOG92820.1 prepilin-type N-terminal cleavage/methylation domain-containing protein [Armatimonadota bacterium]